jgi:hypothetical protein
LQAQIDTFTALASAYIPVDHDSDEAIFGTEDVFGEVRAPSDDDTWSDVDTEHAMPDASLPEAPSIHPENFLLCLPSALGPPWTKKPSNIPIVQQELELRKGQANDALHQIRISLAHKSFLFRTSIRNANSQQKKTRAWKELHGVDATVRQHVSLYRNARSAMVHLGADQPTLTRYQVLTKKDLSVSTAVIDIRAPRGSEATLAWFWSMDVKGDTETDSWMAECMLFLIL